MTTDGTWSGNLYDFYRLVMRRLSVDLKVPFKLRGAERVDETPVHIALREALVNTIIHADYTGRVSLLVVKRPDMFGFRNPGGVRIPLADAKRGGISDCRNKNLQKMFQLIGAGEQAGSGMPKIYTNWKSQSWRQPEFVDKISGEREETLLRLRMANLLPQEAIDDLVLIFGESFYSLPETQRIALVEASIEGSLTHSRLAEMTNEHPRDLSKILHELVENKFLESDGTGRGTFYYLPGCHPDSEETKHVDIFAGMSTMLSDKSTEPADKSTEPADKSTEPADKSAEPADKSTEPADKSSEFSNKNTENAARLKIIAAPISSGKRSPRNRIRTVIIELCAESELSVAEVAMLLCRKESTIRQYVDELCQEKILKTKYKTRSHPRQKYRTIAGDKSE